MAAELTPRQRRFVDEYMVDLNATQAAIRAGYSKRTAAKIASQLLDKTGVAAAIEERKAALAKKTDTDAAWVIKNLKRNHRRAMRARVKDGGAVANKALELIGRHIGMFTDKVLHGSDPENPLKAEVVHVYLPDNGRGLPK
jgi:phage terminase small subunit